MSELYLRRVIRGDNLHEGAKVLEGVEVGEEHSHIVGDLLLAGALDLELLLVELAKPIHAAADIFVIEEGTRVVIHGELNEENGVSLV